MDSNEDQSNTLETLEDPSTSVNPEVNDANPIVDTPADNLPTKKPNRFHKFDRFTQYLNVYLLLFIVIFVFAIFITFYSYKSTDNSNKQPAQSQSLSDEALKDINNSDLTIGDASQILGIKSNTIFSGKVLVKDSLDIAGTIKVGGAVSLPGLNVTGTSVLDQIQGNSLSLTGDANIQGQVNVQKSLVVTGGASFGGSISAPQITIGSLQLSSDLQLNRHIDAGGATPTKTDGSALGAGGTSSISGTDTAGTVTINLGGGPPTNGGCFVTVTFAQKFNSTPHISITPVGSSAGGLNYYINRTTTNFSICANNNANAGNSFSFDYIAID